jgi:DNA-binding LytR/AlgR family response regulator
MNCIIIEDEPAAQIILQSYIAKCPDFRLCETFYDAISAQTFLDSNPVDLIFLDINLPEMSGVSFLRSLVRPPMVIFTTAYPEYAVEGFDLEVVDFLLKPFSFERFCKAVNKARGKQNNRNQPATPAKLSVKSDKRIYQVATDDILFVETCGDYVMLYCTGKKLVVHGTLKSWEEKLKGLSFMKIHRTAIVNLQRIDHLEGNLIGIGEHRLPVSEQYKEQLIERMGSSGS